MAYTKLFSFLLLSTLFLFSSLLPGESMVHRRFMRTKTIAAVAQFLSAHNSVRAGHNLPLLQWSTKLANFAKWYANKRRGDCALVHSISNYGENISWGMGSRWKPSDAVAAWAAQEAYYDYKDNTCMPNKECLHYTQLVWRSTVKVGCAQIRCNSGDTFIVCEYDPHGNIIGERPLIFCQQSQL